MEELEQCSWSIELLQEMHHEDKLISNVFPSSCGRDLDNSFDVTTQLQGLKDSRDN